MSDAEQKTPNKTGASGASWSDAEKIAYLLILCEDGGRVEAKITNAPIPAGRSVVSCKKLLWRLNQKHKEDIEKIKAGQAVAEGNASEKPKATPRKRKAKAETDAEGEAEGTPTKKNGGRKKKAEETVKEEADNGEIKIKVKEEEEEEETVEDEVEV